MHVNVLFSCDQWGDVIVACIFGFDIGTTSIGFAVIDHDSELETGGILRLGVRVFPEARDPDGTPLNQTRRQKRMVRRQLRRRKARRRSLNELLAKSGLLPTFRSDDWPAVMAIEPYALRKRGLEEALSAHELGRALYHLAKRRHFHGRDIEDEEPGEKEKDDADEKAAKTERESTLQALKAANTTLGAWLADRGPHDRRRGVHAQRKVVEEEFEKLWIAQETHHPILKDEAFKAEVEDAIFKQRPVFWRKNTLGQCRLMPGEPLCPKGAWLSQQRRMLEKLNNLALAGGNARPLDAEERAAILEKLQTQASMTWGGVRAALKPLFKQNGDPGGEKKLKFNLELGGESKLLGNPLEAKLADIFGPAWAGHPQKQAIRDAVHQRLWSADYGEIGGRRVVILAECQRRANREKAAESFVRDFDVSPEQADKLKALTLPTGWEPFSTRALEAFLPKLEAGVRFGELVNGPDWEDWRNVTFPNRDRPTGEILPRLPSPKDKEERERLAKLRNPTVVRAQNELRKVVNNLIGMFGKPDLIRVEVARDVGLSKREREEKQSGIRKNERRRREAVRDLETNGIAEPSRDTVEKWLLWKESRERCPYTGDQIGFDALFREGGFDVEHIWPRSRSFDDGIRNKTLCRRDVNLAKGNRTPFEYLGHDGDRWAAIQARLDGLMAKKGGDGMPPGKVKRFLAESMPDDFAERQLNDTGYAARQALACLKRLWPDVGQKAPVTVQAITGRVTAQLRELWGLNNILSDDGRKTRADHRHHAIDALTVACTHPGMTNRLSRYWQAKDDPRAQQPHLPPPWPAIRADAEAAVGRIVVSHRVRKKVSGPLHKEMPWGYTEQDIAKDGRSLRVYVKRMPVEKLGLETLKISRVEDISRTAKFVVRDEAIRKTLLRHLEAANVLPTKAYPPYPRVSPDGPEIKKVRVLTVQQKNLMMPVSKVRDPASRAKRPNGFADPANNHHIAIFRLPDGRADFEVVSLFEAARRLARREPVVRRTRDDGAAFVMSLAPGDAIEFPEGEKKGIWIVQGAWANGQVVLSRLTDAVGSTVTRPNPGAVLREGGRKVSIDPIGQIRPAND
jgi:CRISPR-associated endonuclease Csn1